MSTTKLDLAGLRVETFEAAEPIAQELAIPITMPTDDWFGCCDY